jgi:putative ABC transport system substrate-binding protein
LIAFPENVPLSQAWTKGLADELGRLGWVQGKNVRIDYRYASGDPNLFQQDAAELVGLAPDVILAVTAPAVRALRAQTRTIPIVFVVAPDPVGLGFVRTLARPGGNITGFASYDAAIIGKWIELLKEVEPALTHVAMLHNPDTANTASLPFDAVIQAAQSLGITVKLAPVHDDAEIKATVAAVPGKPEGGLVVLPDSFNVTHHEVIVAKAIQHRLPIVTFTGFVRFGGLLSYWFQEVQIIPPAAAYVDRILCGANPAELPVQYPSRYFLIVNLKTAKAIGLTVPQSVLARADELIE